MMEANSGNAFDVRRRYREFIELMATHQVLVMIYDREL
jgi:hypothetical protein